MNDYTKVTECRVTLSVFSRTRELGYVSEGLGLSPTKEYFKGERVPPHVNGLASERISEFNMWLFKVDIDDLRSLEDHFSALIELLNDERVAQLRAISSECRVTIDVYIINEAGIEISNDLMAVLSRCGASMSIDVQN
jgi:hypothetical protein